MHFELRTFWSFVRNLAMNFYLFFWLKSIVQSVCEHPAKTCPAKIRFSRYSSTKLWFLPDGKSGVQRSRYISRTVYATENLIWYSESTINSHSPLSHQIFVYLSSSCWNFDLKTANFRAFFEWFSGIFSPTKGDKYDTDNWGSEKKTSTFFRLKVEEGKKTLTYKFFRNS